MNPISLEKNNFIFGNLETTSVATASVSVSDQLMELGSTVDEVVSFNFDDFLDENMLESTSSDLDKEVITVKDEHNKVKLQSIAVQGEGVEKLDESIEIQNEGAEETNIGTEEKKEGKEIKSTTKVHVQENALVRLNAIESAKIAKVVVQTGESVKISSIEAISIAKKEFKNTHIIENNNWVLITECKDKSKVKDRITTNEFNSDVVVSRHGKYKIGDKITLPNGQKSVVTRYETEEEEKTFDKNWTVFLLALQRYEAETSQIEKKEKPKAKEVGLEQRIHQLPIQTAKPPDSSEIINEIRKNDYKEADKLNMDRANANQKSALKAKINKEDEVKTKIKESISAKNLKMDIIAEYNKICNKTISDLTSLLNASENYLKKDHALCQLPIKTSDKKFAH